MGWQNINQCRLILLNYNDLVKERDNLRCKKEAFYKKYFTRDDYVLEEMLTAEDGPVWYEMIERIVDLTDKIERWERGYNKSRPP